MDSENFEKDLKRVKVALILCFVAIICVFIFWARDFLQTHEEMLDEETVKKILFKKKFHSDLSTDEFYQDLFDDYVENKKG